VGLGLASLGAPLSTRDLHAVWGIVDPDHTGTVDLYGFLHLLQSVVRGGYDAELPTDDQVAAAVGTRGTEIPAEEAVVYTRQVDAVMPQSPARPRRILATLTDEASTSSTIRQIVQGLQQKRLDLVTAFHKCSVAGCATPAELVAGLADIGVVLSVDQVRALAVL
jgi:hypothetical protein